MDNGSVISGIGAEVGHGSFVAPIPEFTTDDTLVNIGQSVSSVISQYVCLQAGTGHLKVVHQKPVLKKTL